MPQDLRRFHHSAQSHFLTFSCYRRQPKFDTPDSFDLFVVTLEEMRRRFLMRIYGYVVMPEHVHLLVSEPGRVPEPTVPQVRVRSLDANLGPNHPINQVTLAQAVPQVRVRSLDANPGPNHSETPVTLADAMHFLKLAFAKRLRGQNGAETSFWQKRYYDRNVRDEHDFKVKLRYLHRNPVKRGLVQDPADWKWSSYRHYALREVGPVEIESAWTAVDRETRTRGGPPRVFLSPSP
jgi:REP-associated tyrosine transposase